jgi:hypothetical protein
VLATARKAASAVPSATATASATRRPVPERSNCAFPSCAGELLPRLPGAAPNGRGRQGRRVVSAFIATAFAQDDAEAARAQWRGVADQLRPKLPKLAAYLDETEADVLAYMTFPAQHRAKLHSTNPIERLNGEIKRRTEVVAARAER